MAFANEFPVNNNQLSVKRKTKDKQGDCKTIQEGLGDGGHLAGTGQQTSWCLPSSMSCQLNSCQASSHIIDTFCCVCFLAHDSHQQIYFGLEVVSLSSQSNDFGSHVEEGGTGGWKGVEGEQAWEMHSGAMSKISPNIISSIIQIFAYYYFGAT